MTSINTNIAATTALRTLQQTNAQLDQTQARISTGLKIGEAKDNAAYWSISTTLRSDNKALGTVKDALSLGAATVDTAYQGLNQTLDVLNEIKTKLVAASQDGVNKVAVQAEITELKRQLESIANASVFSSENWLSADKSATAALGKNIVSSFNHVDGAVTLDTVEVDTTSFVLFDTRATTAERTGLLQGRTGTAETGALAVAALFTANNDTGAAAADPAPAEAATLNIDFGSTARAIGSGETITFTLALDGGEARDVVINSATLVAAGITDGEISNRDEFAAVLTSAIRTAGFEASDITVTNGSGTTVDIKTVDTGVGAGLTMTVGAASATVRGVMDIDIATATRAEIEAAVTVVNTASNAVTAAAANLGAVGSRIELQQSFVSNLMDTIDAGVSGLIDADMNEESTRLQALQVKQQLGVQALSIANQSAQNVLSLFR